jgi:hypothetical protein
MSRRAPGPRLLDEQAEPLASRGQAAFPFWVGSAQAERVGDRGEIFDMGVRGVETKPHGDE